MNTEQQLNRVAERYRSLGYTVTVRPGSEKLPPFAKDFKLEILATGEDGNVLAVAKASPSELEADSNVPRYAEITDQQPGWRLDLYVLGSDREPMAGKLAAEEPQEEEVRGHLDAAEEILRAGFVRQSLVAAWAALEAAMRMRLRAGGEEAGWGTSPRTMLNELYSSGILSTSDLRHLESLFQLRSAIVHGFSVPVVEPAAVQFLIDTARRLLAESQPARQTA